jgi:hypothetical protein
MNWILSLLIARYLPQHTHTLLSNILFAYSYVKTNMKPAQFNQLFHRNTNYAVTSFVSPEKAASNCPMRKLMDKHRDAVKRGDVFSRFYM